MVSLIQNAAFEEPMLLARWKSACFGRAFCLEFKNVAAEIPDGNAGNAEDLARIRHAAHRLSSFAQDEPGSLEGLTESSPAVAQVRSKGGGGNLLVVDDNAANRDILRRHLETQGYGVTAAGDGEECLRLLESGAFDLVLLDVLMPVMDGFEVLKQMRANPALRETPVVMISALDESAAWCAVSRWARKTI